MRLSTVILPIHRWPEGRELWRTAEQLGFHAAYTYDHLSWQSFRDHPWFGAVPTLTAAAAATDRIRLGTLVTSPNFRHPVTLAKDLMTIDDISGGRLTVGIGAGGTGFDATALGQQPWPAKERAARFGEFLPLLDKLLTGDITTSDGEYYAAHEARMLPGCVQRPRVPFTVAATGPRGLALTAKYGDGWVSFGDPSGAANGPDVIRTQLAGLDAALVSAGRDPAAVDRVLLTGFTPERPLASMDEFVDFAGTYARLGITEIVLHWPVPDSIFAADMAVFEHIATEGLKQLAT